MLIRYRYKDSPKGETIGLPIDQCTMDTPSGSKIRITVLIPNEQDLSKYCEVYILCEEDEEWRTEALNDTFGNRPLEKDDLIIMPTPLDQVERDIYYVWDDGATQHMAKAQRLYEVYMNDIKDASDAANEIRATILREQYEKEIAHAKTAGWDIASVKIPHSSESYGFVEYFSVGP